MVLHSAQHSLRVHCCITKNPSPKRQQISQPANQPTIPLVHIITDAPQTSTTNAPTPSASATTTKTSQETKEVDRGAHKSKSETRRNSLPVSIKHHRTPSLHYCQQQHRAINNKINNTIDRTPSIERQPNRADTNSSSTATTTTITTRTTNTKMYTFEHHRSAITTLLHQTTSLFMGICMCELPDIAQKRQTSSKQSLSVRRHADDDPIMIKKSIVGNRTTSTADEGDDDTASTSSMNPLSFDNDLDEDYLLHQISIDEIQLDLQNGNYQEVFRQRIEEDGDNGIPEERYRYFLPRRALNPAK